MSPAERIVDTDRAQVAGHRLVEQQRVAGQLLDPQAHRHQLVLAADHAHREALAALQQRRRGLLQRAGRVHAHLPEQLAELHELLGQGGGDHRGQTVSGPGIRPVTTYTIRRATATAWSA
jgi:hypothetical protein